MLLKNENALLGSNKNVNHQAPQSVAPKYNTESDRIQENNYIILKLNQFTVELKKKKLNKMAHKSAVDTVGRLGRFYSHSRRRWGSRWYRECQQ